METDFSIDITSVIPLAINKVLSYLGKDPANEKARKSLEKNIKLSIERASHVQCVGMDKPIPIQKIYQQTKITNNIYSDKTFDFTDLVYSKISAVIMGGPGSGKTTLLHWMLLSLVPRSGYTPVLFTLRHPNAINDLRSFIKHLVQANKIIADDENLVLLVDGYDEIDIEDRKKVSLLLQEFSSLDKGCYYLSCRNHYTIIDLSVQNFQIKSFNNDDAYQYVVAFFKIYKIDYSANKIIKELKERGFNDFIGNPLMLALVCILKTSSMPNLPNNSITLIRRAIDVLTFRWDERKGVAREATIEIDGEERIRCLMKIAYKYNKPIGTELQAINTTESYLKLIQKTEVSAIKLLLETAQWYGIFVPAFDGKWGFTHRTIHDFLAARYWVESGTFNCDKITRSQWDTRTAYAACLIPDATRCIINSLKRYREFHVIIECLQNNAPFDPQKVAKAVIKRFSNKNLLKFNIKYKNTESAIDLKVTDNFFNKASTEFLFAIKAQSLTGISQGHIIAYLLSESELRDREQTTEKIRQDLNKDLQIIITYDNSVVEYFNKSASLRIQA